MKQEKQFTFQSFKLLTMYQFCVDLLYKWKCSFILNILMISFSNATVFQNWLKENLTITQQETEYSAYFPSALYCSSFILSFLKLFELTISYILSWKQMPFLDIRNAKDTNRSSCTYGVYIKVLKIQELPHPTDILKSVL